VRAAAAVEARVLDRALRRLSALAERIEPAPTISEEPLRTAAVGANEESAEATSSTETAFRHEEVASATSERGVDEAADQPDVDRPSRIAAWSALIVGLALMIAAIAAKSAALGILSFLAYLIAFIIVVSISAPVRSALKIFGWAVGIFILIAGSKSRPTSAGSDPRSIALPPFPLKSRKFRMSGDAILGDGGSVTVYRRPDRSQYALDVHGQGGELASGTKILGAAKFDSRSVSSGEWAGSRSLRG
jgi:hypothetical protein